MINQPDFSKIIFDENRYPYCKIGKVLYTNRQCGNVLMYLAKGCLMFGC
ncbi:MAG: hypothetical protein N2748_02355 [candidate division WOR-3 bacterium]|nr:hypothetical protein [candidate division WOR-3 bacterium]